MRVAKNKILILIVIVIIVIISLLFFLFEKDNKIEIIDQPVNNVATQEDVYVPQDIVLIDVDGKSKNYEFIYNNEKFSVEYTTDHWKIYDSYKIVNELDIKNICNELIKVHPIHGRDMISYRTVDDMTYEWLQHNLAYVLLPKDNLFGLNAKDVDFEPYDQGKSLIEIYEDRTGQKFEFYNIFNKKSIDGK